MRLLLPALQGAPPSDHPYLGHAPRAAYYALLTTHYPLLTTTHYWHDSTVAYLPLTAQYDDSLPPTLTMAILAPTHHGDTRSYSPWLP